MRTWLTILSLLIVAPGWDGPERLPLLGTDTRITVTRVPLDPGDLARTRVGRLTYLGGVRLTSRDPVFGGFSALHVAGDRFTLLSDGGNLVRFRLDKQWQMSDASFAELPGGPGTGWTKSERDSESLIVDPATGEMVVGLEGRNQIWRYDAAFSRVIRHVAPPAMRKWDSNGGPEAMVRLRDGSWIVFAESTDVPDGGPGRPALRFAGDPTRWPNRVRPFVYLPPEGHDPSDAALLPDGRIIVLNRRFALPFDFSATLTILEPRRIKAGARVAGKPIATLAAPLTRDNFEGVSVTREGADTILWLVSDDNQLFLEHTLLMKFRLDPR